MRELFSVSAPLKNLYNELVPAGARRNIESPADADSSFEPPTVQELRDALLSEASLSRELLPTLKAITESGRRYLAATEDMTARERFAGFVEICLEAYADRSAEAGFELQRLLVDVNPDLALQLLLFSADQGCVESRHAVLFENWQAYAHCSPVTLHLWTRHVFQHGLSGTAARAAILYSVGTFGFVDDETALACLDDEYRLQAEVGEPARDVLICEAALDLIKGAEIESAHLHPAAIDWMKRLRRSSRVVAYGRRFD